MIRNILITGASSGIGKALALAYASPDAHLILVARNKPVLQELQQTCESKGAKVHLIVADLADMDQVDRVIQHVSATYPALHILINNAGISQRSQAEETAASVDRSIMEINFFSPVRLTKGLWPLLCNTTHSNIVNISSVTGTFGFPQRSAYAASKHAMEGFFESWMLENKQPHVHFTTVAPGRILTNISYNALTSNGSKHQLLDEGQAKGIKAEVCAAKIKAAVKRNQRKVYIVQQERILLFLHRFFPAGFVYLVRKLRLA